MYVGLKQPRGDGERYVTPARAAAKETMITHDPPTSAKSSIEPHIVVDVLNGTRCQVTSN